VVVVEATVVAVDRRVVVVVGATVVVVDRCVVVVVGPSVVTVVVGRVPADEAPHTSISANPTFLVVLETPFTVSVSHVMLLVAKVMVWAAPLLGRAPVEILVPSEKVMVAAVIWSSRFGRS